MFVGFGVFFARFATASPAFGDQPRFYFETTSPASVGSTVSVRVLFDDETPVNAYSVKISYPADRLEFSDFNDGHSIINVWQSRSLLAPGVIEISGGSLSPFFGKQGEIVTLHFKALTEGLVRIGFLNTRAYSADGRGTEISPAEEQIQLAVGPPSGAPQANPADHASPRITFLAITPDPLNPRQKFLAFSTTDPDSGIRLNEVRTLSSFLWSDWSPAMNPALLTRSAWAVEFRSTDNLGNITKAVVYDWGLIGSFMLTAGSAILAALGVAWYVLRFA